MTITATDIKAFRMEYQFTQAELGDAIDANRGYISSIEQGVREPYPDLQGRLAEFFGFVRQCAAEGRL